MFDVWLHGMANEYQAFLENLTLPSFSQLMLDARRMNESAKRPPPPSLANHPNPTMNTIFIKRSIVATIKKSQEARPSKSTRLYFKQERKPEYRQEKKVFPPFPYGIKKATALLEQ